MEVLYTILIDNGQETIWGKKVLEKYVYTSTGFYHVTIERSNEDRNVYREVYEKVSESCLLYRELVNKIKS